MPGARASVSPLARKLLVYSWSIDGDRTPAGARGCYTFARFSTQRGRAASIEPSGYRPPKLWGNISRSILRLGLLGVEAV